jgi:hypothetical protein
VTGFWWVAGAIGVVYVALFFLARRPVALRLGRLGGTLAAVLGLRLTLAVTGYPLRSGMDTRLVGIALVAAVCFRSGRRAWLLQASEEDLRRQIVNTCRGLFLECQEDPPGRFLLTAREHVWPLRIRGVSDRIQLLILPQPAARGKAALLIQWLAKQYPGPIPRLRRVLKRRSR